MLMCVKLIVVVMFGVVFVVLCVVCVDGFVIELWCVDDV